MDQQKVCNIHASFSTFFFLNVTISVLFSFLSFFLPFFLFSFFFFLSIVVALRRWVDTKNGQRSGCPAGWRRSSGR